MVFIQLILMNNVHFLSKLALVHLSNAFSKTMRKRILQVASSTVCSGKSAHSGIPLLICSERGCQWRGRNGEYVVETDDKDGKLQGARCIQASDPAYSVVRCQEK